MALGKGNATFRPLQSASSLTGLSSLAIGADQLFSELILALGGGLEVILPFPRYRETFASETDLERYRSLLGSAASINVLPALPKREGILSGRRTASGRSIRPGDCSVERAAGRRAGRHRGHRPIRAGEPQRGPASRSRDEETDHPYLQHPVGSLFL